MAMVADSKAKASALLNRSNNGSSDKGPKIAGKTTYDNGNVVITLPQRLTMDMVRYGINDKGKDTFGLCVALGDLEFVAVITDESGEEQEMVLTSRQVHLNINNLR